MAIKILWIDDEIDLLKPHQLFLEKKGYDTTMINNATDALEEIEKENFAAPYQKLRNCVQTFLLLWSQKVKKSISWKMQLVHI